jgi:hypothetical protein
MCSSFAGIVSNKRPHRSHLILEDSPPALLLVDGGVVDDSNHILLRVNKNKLNNTFYY